MLVQIVFKVAGFCKCHDLGGEGFKKTLENKNSLDMP